MNEFVVPLEDPKPNVGRFLDAMDGKVEPDRPPTIEYLVDDSLMRPILEERMGRPWIERAELADQTGGQMDLSHESRDTARNWLDNLIEFWYRMGYDFVRIEASLALPAAPHVAPDPAKGNEDHDRAWQELHEGPIKDWDDFEKYPWPEVRDSDFFSHQTICERLPDGMGLISCHAGGVYEHTSRLLGYENLCYKLADDPDFVRAVADRIGELVLEYNRRLLQFDRFVAILQGDDYGFNTQTLIPPAALRTVFLPWHKRYAALMHEHGRRYYLHSCGEVSAIMDDLIDDVGIDGKHSFQDNILPITEAKKLYGDRIALLGGIDVHKLTTLGPDDLRRHVREMIDACAPGGRFAVGSGNSIPSYIPLENYLTMVDEALR